MIWVFYTIALPGVFLNSTTSVLREVQLQAEPTQPRVKERESSVLSEHFNDVLCVF